MHGAGGNQTGNGHRPGKPGSELTALGKRLEEKNQVLKIHWPPLGGDFYIIPPARATEFVQKKVVWFTVAEIARLLNEGVTDERSLLVLMRVKRQTGGYIEQVTPPAPVTRKTDRDAVAVSQESALAQKVGV